ncbi:hypothetical protein [Microvirga calopogonii]|uniref:hypothetical protein n=1 Tax=Microvirga calopogonii TaxID=2078013 RepID=UPI000E0CDE90|nr:hypothetical protein [Microvirga calopogonii]
MADTPKHPTTRADYDAHAMRAFRESLEQARKALRDTDYMVTPDRAKLVHPDQQEEPPRGPK